MVSLVAAAGADGAALLPVVAMTSVDAEEVVLLLAGRVVDLVIMLGAAGYGSAGEAAGRLRGCEPAGT